MLILPINLIIGGQFLRRKRSKKKVLLLDHPLESNQKWVLGYEGRYFVDDVGQVFSLVSGCVKKMKGAVVFSHERGRRGYPVVCLTSIDGVSETHYVHRIVAEAFLPNPLGLPQVNHKDGNKENNKVSNLEWVSASDNMKHGHSIGLLGGSMFDEENYRITVVDDFINKGVYSKFVDDWSVTTIQKRVTPEDLKRNGIPPEMINLTMKSKGYRYTWCRVLRIFTVLNEGLTLKESATILGIDPSTVCYIRNNKRLVQERILYDKYKNNPEFYLKHLDLLKSMKQ